SRFVLAMKGMDIKARWCIRGYLDPDILDLKTQAPTLSMEGFAITLQLLASKKWEINIADVEGAFLQGEAIQRDKGAVYIEPPPGGLPGAPEGGTAWFHSAILDKLKSVNPLKRWRRREGEFQGKYLKQLDNFDINISQEKYSSGMEVIPISRERRREKDTKVTDEEKTQLRGATGGSIWLAMGTRPDVAAATALRELREPQWPTSLRPNWWPYVATSARPASRSKAFRSRTWQFC
ncbi:unnamed protein product, partial [Polarella glacialis]